MVQYLRTKVINISWVPPLTTVMTFNPLLKRMGISIVRCLRGESPDSWNICARTYFVQNPSWNGWRTFQEPHVARRCHTPEKHLVVRFRCIIGELRKSRDWTIRSSGLLLKVSHVISFVVSVLTYHASPWLISGFSFDMYAFLLEFILISTFDQHVKVNFCSFWPEWLLEPGTSSSSTVTPLVGANLVWTEATRIFV